jgi:hypothetical protein
MAFASINQASVGGGSSNALAIQSDGIFMPRLSTGQRTALALTTGDTGLTVYDFTLKNLFIWNGTAWESIPGSGDAGANGSVQYNDNGIVSGATNFVWDKVNGRVGIGTASPTATLDVVSGGTASTYTVSAVIRDGTYPASGNPTLELNGFIGGNGYRAGIGSIGGQDLAFYTPSTFGVAPTRRLTLNNIGNLVLFGGTVGANGVGVTFPAVQVASSDANCLDDYEEGTFTPVISSGATAITYATQSGRYTKVGRLVTAIISLRTTACTRDGNQFIIAGLPFASADFGSGVIAFSNAGFIAAVGGNIPNLYTSGSTTEFYSANGSAFAGTLIALDAFDVRFGVTYYA